MFNYFIRMCESKYKLEFTREIKIKKNRKDEKNQK